MYFFRMSFYVIKSLFKKPATLMYPKVPREYYKNTRGSILIEIDKCIFCGICGRKCPTCAISVSKDNKKWEMQRLKCIVCGVCVEVCPKKCLNMDTCYSEALTEYKIETFSCYKK